jgi:AmmeMemoRadiSam system protein A
MLKTFLLNLARNTIKTFLLSKQSPKIDEKNLPSPQLLEKRGSFVSLHTLEGDLRGCIGKIYGEKKLYQDIIDNAISSAFYDPRFSPLTLPELNQIKIEISILTQPNKIDYQNTQELLKKITIGKDGIILKKDGQTATFLPQVWEQLPKKTDFLSHLSLKAGLYSNSWQETDTEFYKYQVKKFSE